MRAIIGANLLKSNAAQFRGAPHEIRDTRLIGFLLRIERNVRTYYAEWGRGKRKKLGRVDDLKADEARDRCKIVLGNVAHGRPPLAGIKGAEQLETLGQFIDDTYTPWLRAHRPRTADDTIGKLGQFEEWRSKTLDEITVEAIERWRLKRITEGAKPATVLRNVMTLSGALGRAVKLGRLSENPVLRIERPTIDRSPKVRYLDQAEEKRLREELAKRDVKMREARKSANRWRADRKEEPLPPLPYFGDHLTPAVLVSLNTGLRRGELLALRWSSVDFKAKQLTVEGAAAKSGQTRHVPLNDEALEALKRWKEQAADEERAFPIDTGFKTAWAALLEKAKITKFRWHDLRHHFASRLAQAGVPLNTIRELLGHGSLAMTLRYAHLAPDQKREAVAKLTEGRQ